VLLLDMLVSPTTVALLTTQEAVERLEQHARGKCDPSDVSIYPPFERLYTAAPDVTQRLKDRHAEAVEAAAAVVARNTSDAHAVTEVEAEDNGHMPAVVLYKSRPVWCACALPLSALQNKRKATTLPKYLAVD
jgi:hypothetical protein